MDMQFHDANPESEENEQMTRDNKRAVFAAQMDSTPTERWELKHTLLNKLGETQSVGFTILDHKPSDEEISINRKDLLSQNIWTTQALIELRLASSSTHQETPPP